MLLLLNKQKWRVELSQSPGVRYIILQMGKNGACVCVKATAAAPARKRGRRQRQPASITGATRERNYSVRAFASVTRRWQRPQAALSVGKGKPLGPLLSDNQETNTPNSAATDDHHQHWLH